MRQPGGRSTASTTQRPDHAGRLDERGILRIGIVLAAGFMLAALAAFATPAVRQGHWAGIHLSLAGAALVAVGAFLPHFAITLGGSRPEPAPLRLAGVLSLATGAGGAVAGILSGITSLTVAAALLIWAGIGITAWTAFRPSGDLMGRRHPVVRIAYGSALAEVAIGIGLPVLMVLGWGPAVRDWPQLKVAHAWLNLFGFISLTIVATLVYLYPTILGARIRAQAALPVLVVGTIAGPPVVALGAIFAADGVAVAGGLLSLAGAGALAVYAWDTWRRRGSWTTDPGWHRVSMLHPTVGMAWYVAAVAASLGGLLRDGVAPPGWGLGPLVLPLVAGWTLQVLVGAWTHLLPAVAFTEPSQRARLRGILGRWSMTRLVVWNAGVAIGWAGLAADLLPLALVGVAGFSLAALASVALVAWGLLGGSAVSARRAPGARPPS